MDKADIVLMCTDRMSHAVLNMVNEEHSSKYQPIPNDSIKTIYARMLFTYNYLKALSSDDN